MDYEVIPDWAKQFPDIHRGRVPTARELVEMGILTQDEYDGELRRLREPRS